MITLSLLFTVAIIYGVLWLVFKLIAGILKLAFLPVQIVLGIVFGIIGFVFFTPIVIAFIIPAIVFLIIWAIVSAVAVI